MNINDLKNIYKSLGITEDSLPKQPNLESVKTMIYQKRITKQLEISYKLLDLAVKISMNSKGDMSIDCAFLCKITLQRLLDHYKNILTLSKDYISDVNLISRSMFEGALYFFYLSHDKTKMREWHLYACVETHKLLIAAKNNNEIIPQELLDAISQYKSEYEEKFMKKDGTFHSSWKKSITIKQLAKKTKNFEEMYENYYSPLSDYHHWGISSLSYHYQITEDGQDVKPNQSSESLALISKSIDLANSSIYSLLEASISIFNLDQFTNELKQIMEEFLKIPFAKKLGK